MELFILPFGSLTVGGFSFCKDFVSILAESASLLVVVVVNCLVMAEVKVLSGLPDSQVGGTLLVTPG